MFFFLVFFSVHLSLLSALSPRRRRRLYCFLLDSKTRSQKEVSDSRNKREGGRDKKKKG